MEVKIISMQGVDDELLCLVKKLEETFLARRIPYVIAFAPIALDVSESASVNDGLYVELVESKSSHPLMEYHFDAYSEEDDIRPVVELIKTDFSETDYSEIEDLSFQDMNTLPFSRNMQEEVDFRGSGVAMVLDTLRDINYDLDKENKISVEEKLVLDILDTLRGIKNKEEDQDDSPQPETNDALDFLFGN